MKSRPGLIFTFDDGREIALPCPTADRLAAVIALAPAQGTAETGAQFVQRFIRQVDTLLESAQWLSAPATAAPITGDSLTLCEARQISNAALAQYLGADAKIFTLAMEAAVTDETTRELQHVPLGQVLPILRARSL